MRYFNRCKLCECELTEYLNFYECENCMLIINKDKTKEMKE